MINNEKTFAKYGYTYKTTIDKTMIVCDCDFCGIVFERLKGSLRRVVDLNTLSCSNSECRKQKTKNTNILIYGSVAPTQNESIKKKVKETTFLNYGVENPFQSKQIKDKIKETNLKNLGVEFPSQSQLVQEKIKQTSINVYGVDHFTNNEDIKAKIKKTCLEKYGYSTPTKNENVKAKTKKTCLEKYGVENPRQYFLFKEKIIETNVLKYGEPYPQFKCGKTQAKIQELLNQNGFNFKPDHIILDGKEIDLYDDNFKLGIEYCGLRWHHEQSPKTRDKKYHYDKYINAQQKGVQLITIFEDEYKNKPDVVLSVLLSKLGKFKKRIYARKCEIKELDKKTACNFIGCNHIQSGGLLTMAFGLWYESELVGVISFGRHHRNNDKNILVLNRMCFLPNMQIIGGADKLFKAGISWAKEKKYLSIISWSDNRWSNGKIYEKLGFTLEDELNPDYSYVNIKRPVVRIPKQSMTKKATKCPTEFTEVEWCMINGFGRIWDCGKKRWKFNLT